MLTRCMLVAILSWTIAGHDTKASPGRCDKFAAALDVDEQCRCGRDEKDWKTVLGYGSKKLRSALVVNVPLGKFEQMAVRGMIGVSEC